jgi:glycosyltransferase involved in cell wall biosynthesis
MIPVSVIMMTKNEAHNIALTLPPLIKNFEDVHVLDSNSTDDTGTIARRLKAKVTNFTWNSQYPKKKQWGIDNLPLKHDWVLQIDADEHITDDFINELNHLDFECDGYFVPAKMMWNNKLLHHGIRNNKLCLFKKNAFQYPIIDDLKSTGGWEVEGHYQPVPTNPQHVIGFVKSSLWHSDTHNHWVERHKKYATWEADMNRSGAWPRDPIRWREWTKKYLRRNSLRPIIIFVYGYIFKLGFLDGVQGFDYALCRARYASWIINKK